MHSRVGGWLNDDSENHGRGDADMPRVSHALSISPPKQVPEKNSNIQHLTCNVQLKSAELRYAGVDDLPQSIGDGARRNHDSPELTNRTNAVR